MKKSPFPGMDPWLESHWGDVHARLTLYACDQLQAQLPEGLLARVEEYVAVAAEEGHERISGVRFAPDVRVFEKPDTQPNWEDGGSVATAVDVETEVEAVAVPLLVPRYVEPQTLRTIQIIEPKSGQRVVTSIEFLSPANKTSRAGRDQFCEKQESLLEGEVNLVEIDLVREGKWVLAVPQERVPLRQRSPYRICIVRAERPQVAEFYHVSLRAPLPSLRVPLRPGDADARLDLQPVIEAAYLNGRYGSIDYSQPPLPPLTGADADWAVALLRTKGVVPSEEAV